jgi:hypothetical protein
MRRYHMPEPMKAWGILQWLVWNAVLSACMACIICNYRLMPVTVGLKVDLVACRMQYYQHFLGACYPLETKRFYYRDRIAQLFLKYIGPWPDECQWVTDRETVYWLDEDYIDESSPYFGFIWDQNGLANMLSGRFKGADNRTIIPIPEDVAAAHIIQRFLQLARETGSDEASRDYTALIWHSLDQRPHKLTLNELLALEREMDAEVPSADQPHP